MKKLLSSILCIGAFLFSINAYSEQALSKSIIQQYTQAIKPLDKLMSAHPHFEEQLDNFKMFDTAAKLNLIESSPIYSEIKSVVTKAGFDSIEQFLDMSLRISSAFINTQMNQSSEGMMIDDYIKAMESQLTTMKKQGVSKEVIGPMEANITEQLTSIKLAREVAKNASKADIQFINDNIEWVTQMLEFDEE